MNYAAILKLTNVIAKIDVFNNVSKLKLKRRLYESNSFRHRRNAYGIQEYAAFVAGFLQGRFPLCLQQTFAEHNRK